MRLLLLAAISFLILLVPTKAYAQENWIIEKFNADINILEDGKVSIGETINVDFGSLQKHGIFRDIPFIYSTQDGDKRYTKINVVSVMANGFQVPYETSSSGDYIRIKIGDPDKTVSGRQVYEIEYLASGVLNSFESYDELYWNVTGSAWPVPMLEAGATVTLPKEGINQLTCFQGGFGSKDKCTYSQENNLSAGFSGSSLQAGQGLTVIVGYTKGLVPIITIDAPKSVQDSLFTLPNLVIFLIFMVLGVMGVFFLWLKKGRDFWWRGRFLFDLSARHEVKPIGAHETVVVEYGPPEKLRPAEIGVLMDEKADTLDVSASIIDLASRGYLTIGETPKTWLFGKTDYNLAKVQKDTKELLPYEKELLNRLFDEADIVSVSSLKTKFYEDLKEVKLKLYEQVVQRKLFVENPERVRYKYLVTSTSVVAVGVGLIFLGSRLNFAPLVAAAAGTIPAGVLWMVISLFMPRRTALGRELYRRSRGYELFISKAEKYRQIFFERKNMFSEILPYAIVFGLTEKFARAFKDMGIEPAQPAWYSGSAPFNAALFGASIANFSGSLSSAMASAPGGSGFSSGGGFSGGGFGGGGGGSW